MYSIFYISPENVKKWAIRQMLENKKIKEYLEKIIRCSEKCKNLSLGDFILDTGEILVPVYITDASWAEGSGICYWKGVFDYPGWKGIVPLPNQSIGLDANDLFQSDIFDSDISDEQDAAGKLIHEFTHWLTAYCLGYKYSPYWKDIKDKTRAHDEGKFVELMVDWSIFGPKPSREPVQFIPGPVENPDWPIEDPNHPGEA